MSKEKYQPTIGLEIHARLDTDTKMFCSCCNDSGEKKPNVNVCPVCLAHPGTLPVINEDAVEKVVMLGLALGGNIAKTTHFDRKSYFYPDLPKGFQISQYDEPLVSGGKLCGVDITRVHLEEDAGSLVHAEDGDSLVDYNRAGTPLAELVTEPDMRSVKEVVEFAKELQLILKYLGVSKADMEKGEMRVEANISLNMGTKVELKNINSFRAVGGAIEYEVKRQKKILEDGGEVEQETRGWDPKKQKTFSQRSKEEAHDYRYFPEPDLPPLDLSNWDIEEMKRDLPELPDQKRKRFMDEFGLSEEDVETLVNNKREAEYFEEAVSELKTFDDVDIKALYHYLTGDLRGLMSDKGVEFKDIKIDPEDFAHFVHLSSSGELSSRLAKDMLLEMFETGKDPEAIKEEGDFEVIGAGSELKEMAEEVIDENEGAVSDYKSGKEEAIKFLVGQMMKKSKGQADPQKSAEVLKEVLDEN
ncbi:MAG TPA: Asp-tRNA(Asn)/Glu-tRNA(Gln) amidotransferase subunit GatB [Candidatus Paceibacterota bacterium]|nr:Asp-tRNA(Asn)/Glu-tRNA(Gln) amidotransferase subunit GatB [Candidatus Paceibacterota bacterium]